VLAYASSEHPGRDEVLVNRRVRGLLRQMLQRQRELLAAEPGTTERDWLLERLDQEFLDLENDPRRVLWQDGAPPVVTASLAPFRQQLDELFCSGTAELELTRNRQRFLGIQGD